MDQLHVLWLIKVLAMRFGQIELAYIQIMSVGFPIDVTRLLGDNQRFHRELTLAQQLNQQLRGQLDQALASNQALRSECEQLQRQKQSELNSFIANHQELYETELATLRMERQQLIEKIKQLDEQQASSSLNLTIQQLTKEIERHEAEREAMEGNLLELRQIMTAQQQEMNLKFVKDITQKQVKIKELQSINSDLKEREQQLIVQLSKQQAQKEIKEHDYSNLKDKITELEANWNSLAQKTSLEILTQLIQLRNQKFQLQKQVNSVQLAALIDDQQIYSLVQRLHQEQAALRYQLTQARNTSSQQEVIFHNQRAQFRNERAQKELQILKQQKEIDFLNKQDQHHKIKLLQLEQQLAAHKQDSVSKQKTEQQIALLKIKVFVLESLRGSQKYRRQTEQQVDYNKFEAQFQAFSAFKLKSSRTEVLNNVASMHVAMTETLQQLKQEESKRREANRKSKDYKMRWESASRREAQNIRALERSRQKEGQYQRLIEKMQGQLEKAYMSSEGGDRHSLTILVSSYQQKLQLAVRQISQLQDQLRQCVANAQIQKLNQDKQNQKMLALNKQMQTTYNQLLNKNRTLENKILEQSLSAATTKIGKTYQAELAEKTAALILTEQEMQSLRDQLASIKEANQKQLGTIGKLEDEVSRLRQQLTSGSPSASGFQQELSFLQQKLAYLQGVLGEQRHATNASTDSHIRALYEQIARLKTETQETNLDKSGRHQQNEIESYRERLIELQSTLRSIANQNEEKNLQIVNLNQENHDLSKQLSKIEEELDLLRGKASSMRELDLIDRNKQLQEQAEDLRKQLNNMQEALHKKTSEVQAVRKQCEEYWSDNLKLLVVIKENNIQLKQNKFLSEKYDQQVTYRQQQLEGKIHSLQNQNQILKNLVQDLRKSILERQSAREHEDSSNKTDIEELRKELQQKQKQILYFREELNRLADQKAKDKDSFDQQWNKLVNQLNDLRQQLEETKRKTTATRDNIKPVTFDQESRIHIIGGHENDDDVTLRNLKATIAHLEEDLAAKGQRIQQLQSQIFQMQYSLKRSGIYSQEVVQLRDQVQGLLESKFTLEDRIRVLQQQNSLLKIKKISENVDNRSEVFEHETFGPSINSHHLIAQLRDSEDTDQNTAQLKNWNGRYEQVLCLLVISFAEIESLRNINQQLHERCNQLEMEYTDRLRYIENSGSLQQSTEAQTNLIHELECGHRHLAELTQRGLREGSVGLAQLGNFTESITGGKMIESYSVRQEDESLASQDAIHM